MKSAFSPPKEVKSKISYGGGFQMPKNKISSPELFNYPQYVSVQNREVNAFNNPVQSQYSIATVEDEIMKLKMESEYLNERWSCKPIDPSILHVDHISYTHRHADQADGNHLSLEELEMLKETQTKKLIDLETEYFRTKNTASFKSGFNLSYSRSSPKRSNEFFTPKAKTVNQNFSQRSRVSPTRKQWESRFERHLQTKEMSKKTQVKGKPKRNTQAKLTPGSAKDKEFEAVSFLRWMFKKLDKDSSGTVDSIELMQEFHANPEIAEMFGLREQAEHPHYMERFKKVFETIGLGNKNEFNLDDFLEFFKNRQVASNPTEEKKVKRPKSPGKNQISSQISQEPICLLNNNQMQVLEEIFADLDEHEDQVLKRYQLIDALKQNERVIKILHVDAVKLGAFQTLNLETMLNFIENDGEGPDEFITWNQFLESFFTRPELTPADKGIPDPRLDEIDIDPRYVSMIKNLFDSLPVKGRGKASTYDFISGAKKDYKIKGFLSMTAREPEGLSSIGRESVGDVLLRMEKEAEALISWSDVLGYFSKRGVPKYELTVDDPNRPVDKEKFAKLTSPKKKVHEISAQTDEVKESKPKESRRNFTKSLSPPRKEVNKSFNDVEDLRQTRIYQKDYPRSTSVEKFEVTVPEPFGFEYRELVKEKSIRQLKFEEMIAGIRLEEERHLNMKYKAKPVPSDVMIPKYESILASQEARRIEVKRTSMETTKANEKPFNFYIRDKEKQKLEPHESPKETFKANPVPWYCKVSLYEQMRSKEKAAREERVARAAQESLRKSSLPPRMEVYEKSKSQQIITPHIDSKEVFRAKDPPNFTKLQSKFQKTLDMNKRAKLSTQPRPFSFDKQVGLTIAQEEQMKREKLKSVHPEVLNEEEHAKFKWGIQDKNEQIGSSGILNKPKIEPSITEKVRDMIMLRKKKMDESEEKSEKLRKEEQERKDKQVAMKSRVQSSSAIQEKLQREKEDREKRQTDKKETMRNQSNIYKEQIRDMNERVKQRPLLVETVADSQLKNVAKMKTLLRVKRSLEESKISIVNYFTEEERELIEEAEYLVKIGKLAV